VLTNPGAQTTIAVTSHPQAVARDGAAAYWRLGDAAGGTAADSIGGQSATLFGGVTTGQAGALADGDAAALFNGSTGYVRAANTAALQIAGNLTLELWINVPLGSRQTLISKDPLREFELTLESNGRLNLYHGNGTASENVLSATGAVVSNTWQHVVVTRSASTKMIRFYVNGVAQGSAAYSLTPAVGTTALSIGRARSGTQYVNGRLDEVAIYPTALSPARVAAHYALRTSTGPEIVTLQLSAADPDGQPLTYSVTGLPPGLSLHATTGIISGAPWPTQIGPFEVTVTVSDGTLSSSQTFMWSIVDGGP
jgi:hypothetical protein